MHACTFLVEAIAALRWLIVIRRAHHTIGLAARVTHTQYYDYRNVYARSCVQRLWVLWGGGALPSTSTSNLSRLRRVRYGGLAAPTCSAREYAITRIAIDLNTETRARAHETTATTMPTTTGTATGAVCLACGVSLVADHHNNACRMPPCVIPTFVLLIQLTSARNRE